MRRKSFQKMHCPIARSLERVGEWWSMLILRDALHGYTRFEEFRESLGVAPNILTTRLARWSRPASWRSASTARILRATNTSRRSAGGISARCC